MPRRYRPEKREVLPDTRYNSVLVQNFINRMMRNGKKSTAATLMYDAMDMIEAKTKRYPLEVFEQAVKNVSPVMEVKPRRVGGATYQVPMEGRLLQKGITRVVFDRGGFLYHGRVRAVAEAAREGGVEL